jgi:hypothetical protein
LASPNYKANKSNLVTLLSQLLRLQLLVRHGIWSQASDALKEAEELFHSYDQERGVTIPTGPQTSESRLAISEGVPPTSSATVNSTIPPLLRVHLLILSIHVNTYFGDSNVTTERLRLLHTLIDEGVLSYPENVLGICQVRRACGGWCWHELTSVIAGLVRFANYWPIIFSTSIATSEDDPSPNYLRPHFSAECGG